MSLLFWGSLTLVLVTLIGGIALVVVRAIELVRTFRVFSRVAAAGAERILSATSVMEQRLAVADPSERLAASVERLQQSLVPAKVLLREVRRLRASLAVLRGAVPRK